MLDEKTIKTLYLNNELDPEKAKTLLSIAEPESQPDDSKFGSKKTACAAFYAVQMSSKSTLDALIDGKPVLFSA